MFWTSPTMACPGLSSTSPPPTCCPWTRQPSNQLRPRMRISCSKRHWTANVEMRFRWKLLPTGWKLSEVLSFFQHRFESFEKLLTHPACVWTRPLWVGFQYSIKNCGMEIPRKSESPVIMRFLIQFMFVNWRKDNPTEAAGHSGMFYQLNAKQVLGT